MPNQDLAHLRPAPHSDEIDLGELIRNLLAQWKLIIGITALGAVLSVIYAITQPKIYKVSAIASVPTLGQLGEATTQNIINLNTSSAFVQFLDQISSYQVKQAVFEQSDLLAKLKENTENSTELDNLTLLNSTLENFKIARIARDYVDVKPEEVPELLDVAIELQTAHPEEAAKYINQLIDESNQLAKKHFEANLVKVKSERISQLERSIEQLTIAERKARLAQIKRIEESHAVKIKEIEQNMNLELVKAKQDRANSIIKYEEALATAKTLNIENPTTWDDLRTKVNQSQITNELNDKGRSEPLYFQGSRILAAEITRLKNRTSDEPFLSSITEYKRQIEAIKNDPALADLKTRVDDTIYLESYNSMLSELAIIEGQITELPSTQFVNVLATAFTPSAPIKPNKALIAIAGTVLAGFMALFIALIRIAVRSDKK